jgi:DNA-3-methyladenine glycosylase II
MAGTGTMTGTRTASMELPARAPFEFARSLDFVRGFPAMAGEQGAGSEVLTTVVREAGAVAVVRLRALPDGAGLRCDVESRQPLTAAVVSAIADRCSFRFGLDDDLAPFYECSAGDEPFRRVVRQLHGYHQVKFPTPLELLCWAILCQRVPMPVARTMKHALMSHCGNEVLVDGRSMRAFPDLDQLLAIDEAAFADVIGNARKAVYLHAAVRHWAEIDPGFLRTGGYDDVRERLLQIPGIGPWSATFLLIRGLGRMERITAGGGRANGDRADRELLRAASRVYGRPVGEAELSELARRYGAWQGYWAHYLRVGS